MADGAVSSRDYARPGDKVVGDARWRGLGCSEVGSRTPVGDTHGGGGGTFMSPHLGTASSAACEELFKEGELGLSPSTARSPGTRDLSRGSTPWDCRGSRRRGVMSTAGAVPRQLLPRR